MKEHEEKYQIVSGSTGNQHPFVSLILPIRNEARSIQATLQSILYQDYPQDCMEILVVDGMSTDGTRKVIQEFSRANPESKIRILDNPYQIVPPALNIGIQGSSGKYIIRVDGHCELPEDYVSTIIERLRSGEVQNVGGQQYPVGQTYLEKAIAIATSSPLFIGNAYYRYGDEERLVDTVFMGAYPREIFDEIGFFDEELVRHQDYDFNLRLRNAGGKILYTPRLKVKYYPRSSIRALIKQYFQYGIWKVRVMQKSHHAFRIRHYAPTTLVLGFLGATLLALIIPSLRDYYAAGVALYLLGAVSASALVSWQHRTWRFLPVLPVIFSAIQFSWGSGFWWGTIKWNFLGHSRTDRNKTRV